jgi:DNA-binding transcriptional ArsR family regulator
MIIMTKSDTRLKEMAQLLKALTHPVRLAILAELRKDEACVCHLEAKLGLRQAYISQQLAVLREAGIVKDNRDGWNNYYSVVDPTIFELFEVSERLLNHNASEVEEANAPPCPCPRCTQVTG